MFHSSLCATRQCVRWRLDGRGPTLVVIYWILASATCADLPAAAHDQEPPASKPGASEPTKGAVAAKTEPEPERKLMADLEAASNAVDDDFDYARFDRELAAAFRRYGLDLDTAGPPTCAGEARRSPIDTRDRCGDRHVVPRSAINTEVDKIAPTAIAIAGHRSRPLA